MTRRRFVLFAAVAVVLAAIITVATWAAARYGPGGSTNGVYGPGSNGSVYGPYGPGPRTGPGMGRPGMTGGYGIPGDGQRVTSLDKARARAQVFADTLGLRTGEVMQFSNGFYAELETPDGKPATEVLIDQSTGAVGIEYGPAMMWNTRFGMHPGAVPNGAAIPASDARDIAQRWLDEHRPGLTAGEADDFPGYVTFDTARGGKDVGMMSVNSYTGAVWYHTWHGRFIAMSEG